MICDKCKQDFSNVVWEKGKTYNGIDQHHNPPEFMVEKWEGEIYNLCRKHHRELHDKIIEILNEGTLKFVKSEYWAWIKIIPSKRQEVIEKVIKFTKGWVDGNSKEITA